MTETYSFDFFQVPHTGVYAPDPVVSGSVFQSKPYEHVRSTSTVVFRRPADMKISNFGALAVGARMPASTDYTRINLGFKAKGESEDWTVLTADTGLGQNVAGRAITVVHNPLVWGSTVKYTRDDQFIRMTMTRNTGTDSLATSIDPPDFDVMDEKERTAAGINLTSGAAMKNWPSEGWRSFGGKYDFLPYSGGTLK